VHILPVIFAAVQNLYNDGAVNIAFTLLLSVYLLTMLMIKQVHLLNVVSVEL